MKPLNCFQLLGLVFTTLPIALVAADDAELARRAHQYYERGNDYYKKATDTDMAQAFRLYLKGFELAKAAEDDSAMGRGSSLLGSIPKLPS